MADDPETLARAASRMIDATPQASALGISLVSAESGSAAMKVAYRAELVGDPDTGVLAGGVITTLLDHACGLAVASFAEATATLDLRIDYMRPAIPGRDVIGKAHCYRKTKSIGFVRAVAYEDDPDDPIATAQGAFMLNTAPKVAV